MVMFIVLFVSQQAQCLTLQVDRANQTHSNIVTSWLPDHSKNKKNTDTDEKKNTEVSVFQYVFEIRSKVKIL